MKSNAKLHAFLNSLLKEELTGINRSRSNSEMNDIHGYSRLYNAIRTQERMMKWRICDKESLFHLNNPIRKIGAYNIFGEKFLY